ncbi:MAG: MATE family efflux transporter [Verrucomicrobiales bacterium]
MAALRHSLTEGPILKSLAALSLPIVFANVLQSAYQLTDTFWVGRLGGEAVAAVSVSFPLIFLTIALGGGFTVAGSTLVAQFTGAGDSRMVNLVAGQTILAVLVAAAVLSTVGYVATGPLLRLVGVEDAVFEEATRYMRISFLGLVFLFGYFMYQSLMRGLGEVRVPLYIVGGTVLLNLVLDPLFIFGWGPVPPMGVAGAAYATIGTQSVAMVVGFAVLFGGHYGIDLREVRFRPHFRMLKQIFVLGLPASIEQSTRATGMSLMIFLVAGFGTVTLAAFGIGTRILTFVVIPALGLSMATATLVGQNMGAGNVPRANAIARLSALVAFVALSVAGVLCFAFAGPLVRFFVPGDAAVTGEAVVFLRIMALFFGLIGVQQAFIGAFRGSGNTLMSMVLALLTVWVFQFPIAYLLSHHTDLGARGLWWAFPVSNVLGCLATAAWFFQGGWQKKRIVRPARAKVSRRIITQEGMQ